MIAFSNSRSSRRLRTARGFTLIELAVVIFIVGLLLGGIVVPLATQVQIRKYDQSQRILDQAREALIGYAATYGYFPCPAIPNTTGLEAAGTSHASATTCPLAVSGTNTYTGNLPAVAIGFTPTDANGYAVDAWGFSQNRIRYAVSKATVNGITQPFTRVNGMRSAGMANIASATTLLYVCNSGTVVTASNCGTAGTLASSVPVVIWSLGPNAATPGGASADEAKNLDNDPVFVSRTKTAAGEGGGEFDDIVTWIGESALFSRLIAAGQLP